MYNRTVRVFGQGFGSTPASITATLNGNVVFNGEIPTVDEPPTVSIENPPILFEFEVPLNTNGNIPQTITINNGTVVFAGISANYNQLPSDPAAPTVFASISWRANYKANPQPGDILGVDPRANPKIDGVLVTPTPYTQEGSVCWWTISQGSVFEYDLVVVPGYSPS